MTGLSAQGHPAYTTNLNLKVRVKSGGPQWTVVIQGH